MKPVINKIFFIPAKFVEVRGDKVVLDCLLTANHQGIERRIFDKILFDDIDNPNLIMIAMISGFMCFQINVMSADEYMYLYKKKWFWLLKN